MENLLSIRCSTISIRADLDLIVAATMENIMMVEGEMNEVSEDEIIEALRVAHEAIKVQCQAQLDLVAMLPHPD
jgi:polyribonucleotide nucleotidyltransferase